MNDVQRLLDIKGKIAKSKSAHEQRLGMLKQLKKDLQDLGCKTVDEAQKKLKGIQKKIKSHKLTLEQGFEKLEELGLE